jgi:hypothetical protein
MHPSAITREFSIGTRFSFRRLEWPLCYTQHFAKSSKLFLVASIFQRCADPLRPPGLSAARLGQRRRISPPKSLKTAIA